MEASLLAPPKPSLLFSTTRGPTRRCVVASAVGRGKRLDLEARPEGTSSDALQRASSKTPRALGLFAMAATAVTMSDALPCHASPAAPPSQELMVPGGLDPATAKVAIAVTGPALSALGFLFVLRIVMSWYPKLPVTEFPYVVAYAPTEPFLAVTRKVIPPLGCVDVTLVVWFGLVSFLNEILVGPQGLLVLLSQQV